MIVAAMWYIIDTVSTYHTDFEHPEQVERTNPPELIDTIKISATNLVLAYTWNELQASRTYYDEWVKVNGTVFQLGLDQYGKCYVSIQARYKNAKSNVICYFENCIDISPIKQGTPVSILGKCKGMNTNVELFYCVLIR